MILKHKLSDYTEQEFIAFIDEINRASLDAPDNIYSSLLLHFAKITEHPAGYDLLYGPASETDNEAEEIMKIVKEWRLTNHKELFKLS